VNRDDLKLLFVQRLAEFLVGDQVAMSIRLQTGTEEALRWARLRSATPLFGYPTLAEAQNTLAKWLGVSKPRKASRRKVTGR
jgi:hypothetical protein